MKKIYPNRYKLKKFKVTAAFLTGQNGVFNVTSKKNKLKSILVFEIVESTVVTLLAGAYEPAV